MGSNLEVVMSGDEAKLWRSLQKIIAQETKAEQGFKKIGDEAQKTEQKVDKLATKMEKVKPPPVPPPVQLQNHLRYTGQMIKQHEQGFGAAAFATVTKFAGGVMGVAVAAGAVASAFRQAKQEREAALSNLRGLGDVDRSLNQISDSPQTLLRHQQRADAAAAKFGVDAKTAREVLFNAESGGFANEYERIMAAKNVADPLASSKMAIELANLFPGQTIKPMEGVNMALAAARASKLNMERIAAALPVAAEGAGSAGASPEETFAIAGKLANSFANESFAPRLKAFGSKVALDPNMKGKGILNAVDALQAMPAAKRRKWLGDSQEVNAAFDKLEQFEDAIRDDVNMIKGVRRDAYGGNSLVDRGIATAATNPDFITRNSVEQSESEAEVAERKAYASPEGLVQSIKNRTRRQMADRKINPVNRALANMLMGMTSTVTTDPYLVNASGSVGANFYGVGANFSRMEEMDEANDRYIKSQLKAAEAAEQLAKSINRSAPRTAAQRAEATRHEEN